MRILIDTTRFNKIQTPFQARYKSIGEMPHSSQQLEISAQYKPSFGRTKLGKLPTELSGIDFSQIDSKTKGVQAIIKTGTFAEIIKFSPQGSEKTYAIKRLYPFRISQPQTDLKAAKRSDVRIQLRKEARIYDRLKGTNEIPEFYFYHGDFAKSDKSLPQNYIITSWAQGSSATKNGAIYDSRKVTPKNLAKIFKLLETFDKKGILHGDLWAGNILFGDKGVKVLDFNDSKIFNPHKEPHKNNLDEFKTRFLNIYLGDVYHRKGEKAFLKAYKRCLAFESKYLDNKHDFYRANNNPQAMKIYAQKLQTMQTVLNSPERLKNQGIKTIFESNTYWAKMMEARKNFGEFEALYYAERAQKVRQQNPEIINKVVVYEIKFKTKEDKFRGENPC